MKTILEVVAQSNQTDEHGYNHLFQLQKEMELPFAPHKGLMLSLNERYGQMDETEFEKYQLIRRNPPARASCFFEVHCVYYEVDNKIFTIVSHIKHQTLEEIESVVEQLIIGYGFTPKYPASTCAK